MKCPHCQISFHNHRHENNVTYDNYTIWAVEYQDCPNCKKSVIEAVGYQSVKTTNGRLRGAEIQRFFIYPKGSTRPAPPEAVPATFAEDYIEASLIIADSPKASAALSRRCLQHLIREVIGIKEKDLATEIQKLIDSNKLPSHLSDAVDAIRNIGNFAAHPIKSTSTGEVIDVEPGEAEWTLDVLDGLFDFLFVQPQLLRSKKAALDAKLASAGKPPTKGIST